MNTLCFYGGLLQNAPHKKCWDIKQLSEDRKFMRDWIFGEGVTILQKHFETL